MRLYSLFVRGNEQREEGGHGGMQKRFLDGGGKSDVRKCLEKKGVGACQTLEEMLRRDTFYSHFIEHFIRTIQICIVYVHDFYDIYSWL